MQENAKKRENLNTYSFEFFYFGKRIEKVKQNPCRSPNSDFGQEDDYGWVQPIHLRNF